MGRYFNPVTDIYSVGRRIQSSCYFNELVSQLSPTELLVGVYDNGMYQIGVLLDCDEEFRQFESRHNSGGFISRKFFAIGPEFHSYVM